MLSQILSFYARVLPGVVLAFLPIIEAIATDQIVTDPGDTGGVNQLRAKLAAAQSTGGGKITFATGLATVVLNSDLPVISTVVIIDGGGSVGISGNNSYHIFSVDYGGSLTLNRLTVSHAFSSAGDGGAVRNYGRLNANDCLFAFNQVSGGYSGGGILNYGTLNLTNSEFASNSGANGGAVYSRFPGSATTVSSCNFHDNVANSPTDGWGGAMLFWDGAPASATRSSFSNNVARFAGGALYLQGPSLFNASSSIFRANYCQYVSSSGGGLGGAIYSQGTNNLSGCVLINNHAYDGGAIYVNSGSGALARSLCVGNWANRYGGAVYQGGGLLNAVDSTFHQNGYVLEAPAITEAGGALYLRNATSYLNRVTLTGNQAYYGGALYAYQAIASVQNATMSGNFASGSGGAIYGFGGTLGFTNMTIYQNQAPPGTGGGCSLSVILTIFSMRNTLFANNSGGNSQSALTGAVFCLSDDNTCGFGLGRDNVGNLLLGPLADNGGATLTHLPLPGSAAIDNGTSLGAPLLDQRGYMRAGAAPDVGATESSGRSMVITSITPTNGNQVLLTGQGLANSQVVIQGSPDLNSENFATLGSTPSDAAGIWHYTNTLPAGPINRFYRAFWNY